MMQLWKRRELIAAQGGDYVESNIYLQRHIGLNVFSGTQKVLNGACHIRGCTELQIQVFIL